MKKLFILTMVIICFVAYGEVTEDDFFECVRDVCMNLAATQSTIGEYHSIEMGDTTSGRYFLLPPQGTFVTVEDTVEFIPMNELKDPWFHIWVDRNPLHRDFLYDREYIGDSASVILVDYLSKDAEKPNVRIGFDKNVCEPYTMTLFWPDTAKHAFPGADVIYYEFVITDQFTLAPTLRYSYNQKGEIVNSFLYNTVDIVRSTPDDDQIIGLLMGTWDFEEKDK